MHSIAAAIAGLIRQLRGYLGAPQPSGLVDNETVRLVRQNGNEFDGSLHQVCLIDALKVLSSCVEEFRTCIEADINFDGRRGFRLIRSEADYLRVCVVGTNDVQVATDYLTYRNSRDTTAALLSSDRIQFSAEIRQVEVVLEQYFSEHREDFEDTYHEYIVSHIGGNPSKLAYATVPPDGVLYIN